MDRSDGYKPGQFANWLFVAGAGGKPGVANRRSVTTRSAEGRRIGELRQGADEKTGDGHSPERHFSRSPDLAPRPCAQPVA